MPVVPCPRCGSPDTICLCQDVGGVEYYDEYTLYCKTCGYTEQRIEYGGSPLSSNFHTKCPFCGKTGLDHMREQEIFRKKEKEVVRVVVSQTYDETDEITLPFLNILGRYLNTLAILL